MSFGPLFFAAPAALFALAALPILFWLLRATPPAPMRAIFPPLRLLLGLTTEEETRARAPVWLVILRGLIAALLIVGFAGPSWRPPSEAKAAGGAVLLVIDDGWTSAPSWSEVKAAADAVAGEAERGGGQIQLLLTAPTRTGQPVEILAGADARARIARLEPKPWRPDRKDAAARLAKDPLPGVSRVVWIADGLNDPNAEDFAQALLQRGPLAVKQPERTARAVGGVMTDGDGIEALVRRGDNGQAQGAVAAETADGRSLSAAEFRLDGAGLSAVRLKLPAEIATRAARVRIVGEDSAGSMRLLATGGGRPFVGLVDPGSSGGQALLSELFYVERAVAPFATTQRGDARALISQGAQALILPDASRIAGPDREAIDAWLEKGGLLIRFAGPRLANAQDDLLPAALRPGARAMGGALAWEKPQTLAAFSADSPFAGLIAPPEVAVRRQVLIEPGAERTVRVWARLADGAPVVTAAPKGQGLLVLVHVTAGPDWSDLPLSGLYVDMLRRTLAFAGRATQANQQTAALDEPWRPERLLNGFGQTAPPGADALAIAANAIDAARPGPAAPPGLYSRSRGETRVVDAIARDEELSPLILPGAAQRLGLEGPRALDLRGPLLALAALFVALDLLIALAVAGRLPRVKLPSLHAAALILALALPAALAPPQAQAKPDDPTQSIRLAFIKTGDARVDRMSETGLEALSQTLFERTAVEPGKVIGVDPARDDLSTYPVLYWAAPSTPARLSDAATANLDRYMRLGGLLFVDTRDGGRASGPDATGPAAVMLAGLDAPPLAPVDREHVLTKAFYLLQNFPGRVRSARVWAESASAAAARDGVAALMVGDGDWAAAWADSGVDPRQREMALRFGVNLVMVALTGNYKADQVHVPALLDRLGQEPAGRRR